MLIRNTRDVSVNDIQSYLIKGAEIHPLLYTSFLEELEDLEFDRKLCLTPQARLELYSRRISTRIARILAA
jgi:Mn-containing catalase